MNWDAVAKPHGLAWSGGGKTGPSPVDHGRKGTKYTLMVDENGVPLAIRIAGANASDHTQIIALLAQQLLEVGGKAGRPKTKPDEVYADAGYDNGATRSILRWLGSIPHIRRRCDSHGSGFGRCLWRTFATA